MKWTSWDGGIFSGVGGTQKKKGHVMGSKLAAELEKALFRQSPGTASGSSKTHRAENSSKVSSWCSERMRLDVLKVLLRLGAARAARAVMGCGRAAARLARNTALEGPRAATRSREADIFFITDG
jgi:hypothetical protein